MTRVLVIGLDGVSYPFLKQNLSEMNNLSKMAKDGVFTLLRSTVPPVTCPAWPSMVTGLNPGKHGLFDFIVLSHGRMKFASSLNIRGKAIWDVLTAHDLRSIVMNVPVTYPPYEINGIMVTGMLTPDGANFVWPLDARERIERAAGGYVVEMKIGTRSSDRAFIQNLMDVERRRTDAFVSLLSEEDWHFAMLVVRATDTLGHFFWGRDEMLEGYRSVDSLLGKIFRAAEDANVLVVSDHGMGPVKKNVHLVQLLYEWGYTYRKRVRTIPNLSDVLRRRKKKPGLKEAMRAITGTLENLLEKAGIEWIRDLMPDFIRRAFPPFEPDYERSLAYTYRLSTMDNVSIVVNAKGEERERVIAEIMERLKTLRDSDGTRVIEAIYRREVIYSGPHVDKAPDIILFLAEGYRKSNDFGPAPITTPKKGLSRPKRGGHRGEGIFLAAGPQITSMKDMSDLTLMDIAPTVYRLFGIDLPDNLDGRPAPCVRSPQATDM